MKKTDSSSAHTGGCAGLEGVSVVVRFPYGEQRPKRKVKVTAND